MRIAIPAACAALALAASVPAAGQTAASPAQPRAPSSAQSNPYRGLWTGWGGVSRDSLQAETRAGQGAGATSTPAASADSQRSRGEAEALGARVGEVVRLGDCEEGERIARAAGDFALVQAVRDHCRRRDQNPG